MTGSSDEGGGKAEEQIPQILEAISFEMKTIIVCLTKFTCELRLPTAH